MADKSRQRIPEAEWNSHRLQIERLFIEEDKSLDQVLHVLKTDYNFTVRCVHIPKTSTLWYSVVVPLADTI
jgi:hypothetical protein